MCASASRKVLLYPRFAHIKLPLWIGFTVFGLVTGGMAISRLVAPSARPDATTLSLAVAGPIGGAFLGGLLGWSLAWYLRRARTRTLSIQADAVWLSGPTGKEISRVAPARLTGTEGTYLRRGGAHLPRPFYALELQVGPHRFGVTAHSVPVHAEDHSLLTPVQVSHAVTDRDYAFLREHLVPHRAHLNRDFQAVADAQGPAYLDANPLL